MDLSGDFNRNVWGDGDEEFSPNSLRSVATPPLNFSAVYGGGEAGGEGGHGGEGERGTDDQAGPDRNKDGQRAEPARNINVFRISDLKPVEDLAATDATAADAAKTEKAKVKEKKDVSEAGTSAAPTEVQATPLAEGRSGDGLSQGTVADRNAPGTSAGTAEAKAERDKSAKFDFTIVLSDNSNKGIFIGSVVWKVRSTIGTEGFEVSRQYSDFEWLYNRLLKFNPGLIVPPIPVKEWGLTSKFLLVKTEDNPDAAEPRRRGLLTMLEKIGLHPILRNDPDFRFFIESPTFQKELRTRPAPVLLDAAERRGSSTDQMNAWLIERRQYFENFSEQLELLRTRFKEISSSRRQIAVACEALQAKVAVLSRAELSTSLSQALNRFCELQADLSRAYKMQAFQNDMTMGITIQEYMQVTYSVGKVFQQRERAINELREEQKRLTKVRATLGQMMQNSSTMVAKIKQLNLEEETRVKRVAEAQALLDTITVRLAGELKRIGEERIRDFAHELQTFLWTAVAAQKHLIFVWEHFMVDLSEQVLEDDEGLKSPDLTQMSSPAQSAVAADQSATTPSSSSHA